MIMKKNGKYAIMSIALLSVGYVLYSKKINLNKFPKQKPNRQQYKNRLSEFCLDDFDNASNEYDTFVDMGFSDSDAFDLTIVRKFYF